MSKFQELYESVVNEEKNDHYVYDPSHGKMPEGSGWHKTTHGWSKVNQAHVGADDKLTPAAQALRDTHIAKHKKKITDMHAFRVGWAHAAKALSSEKGDEFIDKHVECSAGYALFLRGATFVRFTNLISMQ